ncbi:MAG: hypothetical protein IPM25_09625 [Chloracidobacterium sp.]|nr:hypothetical protein [Chloracidobacterium sp.]
MISPISKFVFAAVAALFLFFSDEANAQKLVPGKRPVKTAVAGYQEAFCSQLDGGFSVCKALASDEGDADFVVLKSGQVADRFAASAWASIAITPDGFFAYRGDLDADGSAEIVVVSLESVSQGMGVTYSKAYILDGRTLGGNRTPLSFTIQEFGAGENFVFDPVAGRTNILLSYWAEYSSIEPNRIPGVYLIGKWFRYRGGKLSSILEKPTLARRFLNSFAAERDNGWFENRRPLRWLSDPRAHKLRREPEDRNKPTGIKFGTIKGFSLSSEADEDQSAMFEFAINDGTILKGKVTGIPGGSEGDSNSLKISTFGIWAQRYAYPLSWSMEFDPDVYFDRLDGRRVRIETYRDGDGGEFAKAWLLD